MNQQQQANLIKVAAVVTATPRWVGALLAAEGFVMPANWMNWWLPVSAFLSAGMALVEGLAFAYVFNAWRVQKDKSATRLLWLAILSAIVFVAVLSPFIVAQVRKATLETVLGTGVGVWMWSASVAASTIVIVASVGYAQKQKEPKITKSTTATVGEQPKPFECWCGEAYDTRQGKSAHMKSHANEVREAESVPAAIELLRSKYPSAWGNENEPVTRAQVAEWRK